MKSIVLALLLTASASAETMIFPVQDLLLEHPNFTAPDFSLNSALNAQATLPKAFGSRRGRWSVN